MRQESLKTAYIQFFNPRTSLNESVALLQDGPAFRGTLKRQATTSFAKATTATVSTVTLDSPDKATVVYSILLSGTPVLVDTSGSAVHESGNWKVAGATFCGLLAAQGPPPPACAQATAMSARNCSSPHKQTVAGGSGATTVGSGRWPSCPR
jgi:hypothetical protein